MLSANDNTLLEVPMNIKDTKFLVVDDHDFMRSVTRLYLVSLGANESNIIEAQDGAEGLHMLKAGAFDFVITDMNMPVMDGYELLKRIKADDAHNHIPVLMISGNEDAGYANKAKQLGAIGYIVKPPAQKDLIRILEPVMEIEKT
jgi:two-component system, chemotaxis family, chemotaxis protein CheY